MSTWIVDFITSIVPLKGKPECVKSLYNSILGITRSISGPSGISNIKTLADALSFQFKVAKIFFQSVSNGITCFSDGGDGMAAYLSFVKKTFGWTTWIARTGTAGNIVFGISQWSTDQPSMELCYEKIGNDVNECGNMFTMTTIPISAITSTSAKSGGNIMNDGGFPIFERGVCFGTSMHPTVFLPFNKTSDGTGIGSFDSNLNELNTDTKYYVRSYAINSKGINYGDEVSFTTAPEDSQVLSGLYFIEGFSLNYRVSFRFDLQSNSGTISLPEGDYPASFSLLGTELIVDSSFDRYYEDYGFTQHDFRKYHFRGQLIKSEQSYTYGGNVDIMVTYDFGLPSLTSVGTFQTSSN